MIMLILLGIYSCGTTKNQAKKGQASNKIFVYEEALQKEEFYKNIKGSVARLRAILCGKYVHLSCQGGAKDCDNWRTSSGEDSVMICRIPVGDYCKDGYWVYEYQYLSSLPKDPIHQTFFKLNPINRDTIQATYYDASNLPSDFKIDMTQNIDSVASAFSEVRFKKFKRTPNTLFIDYARQDFTKYKGMSNMTNAGHKLFKYHKFLYHVSCEKNLVEIFLYNEEEEQVQETAVKFLKIAAVNPAMYSF